MSIFQGLDLLSNESYGGLYDIDETLLPFDDGFESYQQMVECEVAMEATSVAMESLSQHLSFLGTTLRTGGITAREAELLHGGISGAMRLIDSESNDISNYIIPSFEAFGTNDTPNKRRTEISMEKMKEILSKGWKAVKKFLMKWIDAIVDFYYKYLGSSVRLEKSARDLAKKASASSRSGTKESTISVNGNTFRDITGGKDQFSSDILQKGLEAFTEVIGEVKEKDAAAGEAITRLMETYSIENIKAATIGDNIAIDSILVGAVGQSVLTSITDSIPKLAKMQSTGASGFVGHITTAEFAKFKNKSVCGDKGEKLDSSLWVWRLTQDMLGNKVAYIKISGAKLGNTDKYLTTDVKIGLAYIEDEDVIKKRHDKEHKITPLKSGSDVATLAEVIADVAKAITESRVDMRVIKKRVDETIKDLDKLNSEVESWTKDYFEKDADGNSKTYGAQYGAVGESTDPNGGNIPARAGTSVGDISKSQITRIVDAYIKTSHNTVRSLAEPYNSIMLQAGSSARAAYDYALASFNNLKDE